MSEFQNIYFVKEFAYRTKLNYYHQQERYAKTENARRKAKIKVENIEREMADKQFDISEYYEVTDLLNSVVGLLVFPEANVFKHIPRFERDLKREFPILYKCVEKAEKEGSYNYSYLTEPYYAEEKSPLAIINHIRNSLAHYRIMIEPISGKISGTNQIVAIVFKDQKPPHSKKPQEFFSLKIDVSDLEDVVMEVCDYLIKLG
ncbi:HEPN family nuclease [Anaerovibrio lipolyticus]|uniref:HEPN family nuclease n=1 Tax=Anaerovibrio lipolyticus TaxID=82374 RepID=UPI0004834932|nr:HEPN family nuclease [Anaerovibrio lipolyticus]